MTTYIKRNELALHIGLEIAVSDWFSVTQKQIDSFAGVTRDEQWIHVDVERAGLEIGGTVAHGFLTLSMLTWLASTSPVVISDGARRVNYGFDRVRFINFVSAGARIRLRQTLVSAHERAGGVLCTRHCVIEIEGEIKPALVAEWLTLFED